MLPERSLFHIEYEPHGAEIHVPPPLALHDRWSRYVGWGGRSGEGTFGWNDIGGWVGGGGGGGGGGEGDGRAELGGAENVGEEGVVVEAPDTVGAGGLEGVGFY